MTLALTYTSFIHGKVTDTNAHSHPVLAALDLYKEEQSANLEAQIQLG